MPRGPRTLVAIVVVLGLGVFAWYAWWPSDERAIRRQLDALAGAVNEEVPEGLGTVMRATQIGSYFTRDIVLTLGRGTAPIHGRDALVGLAARLPAKDGYTLAFDDVDVQLAAVDTASVSLAATLSRRSAPADHSADTRELQIGMTKVDGVWRIARVEAIEVSRRE